MVKRKPKAKEKLVVYLGETDPAEFIHSSKTHRTVSEAFRDADYAYSGWKPKTELDDCKEFIGGMLLISPALLFVIYICYLILKGI